MQELTFIVEESPEGGYTAQAVGESIYTEADDLNDLHHQLRDAVCCHFELLEDLYDLAVMAEGRHEEI